jgi:hypothetical protein
MKEGSTFAIPIGYMQGGIKKARTEDEVEIQGWKAWFFKVVVEV